MSLIFTIGSGSGRGAVGVLTRWLEGAGIRPTTRIDGKPIAEAVFGRLSHRYGAQRYRIVAGNLDVLEQGSWRLLVHRDDIHTFLFGKEVVVEVGPEPDPSEGGVELQVGVSSGGGKITKTTKIKGVVEWEKAGPKVFRCCACGLTRKTKAGIVRHIERDH